MIIDWSKPIETVTGLPAELIKILGTDYKYKYLCSIFFSHDEVVGTFTEDGVGTVYTLRNVNVPVPANVPENVPEKKTPIYRPWKTPDEVPVGVEIQSRESHINPYRSIIILVVYPSFKIYIGGYTDFGFTPEKMLESFRMKVDGKWKPCGVLIE